MGRGPCRGPAPPFLLRSPVVASRDRQPTVSHLTGLGSSAAHLLLSDLKLRLGLAERFDEASGEEAGPDGVLESVM